MKYLLLFFALLANAEFYAARCDQFFGHEQTDVDKALLAYVDPGLFAYIYQGFVSQEQDLVSSSLPSQPTAPSLQPPVSAVLSSNPSTSQTQPDGKLRVIKLVKLLPLDPYAADKTRCD